MKISPLFIASDHAGFDMKQYLIEKSELKMTDLGTFGHESCDYPVFAQKLCKSILVNENSRGVLICFTGIGMSIAANRYKGIRAALCFDKRMAKLSRCHNNSNVIIFGSGIISNEAALNCFRIFLETEFEGNGRHGRRVDMTDEGE
jgi:ribose 5-phosphate isomerase B